LGLEHRNTLCPSHLGLFFWDTVSLYTYMYICMYIHI
jgi:hypothetical protein